MGLEWFIVDWDRRINVEGTQVKISSYRAAFVASLLASTGAYAGTVADYSDFEAMELTPTLAGDFTLGTAPHPTVGVGNTVQTAHAHTGIGFEGIGQYDVQPLGRGFIPPDTMGAVGTTQYMSFVNGGVGVWDKATGARTYFKTDLQFWQGLGRAGANGDSRVMFDKTSGRWIALSFANSVSQLQIAVSDTDNALGPWKSTVFTGYAGFGFGATADYPTMAITQNSLVIGTNNFAPSSAGGSNSFRGTTVTLLPINSILALGGPTVAGGVQYQTPYTGAPTDDFTRGFAIQGVNGSGAGGVDKVLAVSIEANGLTRYNFSGATPNSAVGTTRGAATDFLGLKDYAGNGPARQPSALNGRVVDTLDDRVGSSVYEVNGLIYSVHTVTPVAHGVSTDHTAVRWDVIDANTNVVLAEGNIADATHDYFEGSLAVNAAGQVVIGYNRSGSGADGKIAVLARTYRTVGGRLIQMGGELLLTVSDSGDYHNGSLDGGVAAGRQRWGDYSAVSLDPNDPNSFWVIGEFAREPNNLANGHPGGTGGTRWGTWISQVIVGSAVPEPSNWALLIAGFGLMGAAMRRRSALATVAA